MSVATGNVPIAPSTDAPVPAPEPSPAAGPSLTTTRLQEVPTNEFTQIPLAQTRRESFPIASGIWALNILEVTILLIYPIALFLGFLVQLAGGDYPSYFSDKRNVINVFIVKRGWLWVTIAIGIHAFGIYKRRSRQSITALKNLAIRYALATAWWIFFSQWFFGMPIMDKIFVMTGGKCSGLANVSDANAPFAVTSAQCRYMGGKWTGGYDPSGHTFLLTHSSLYLWSEMLPYLEQILSNKSSSSINQNTLFLKFSVILGSIYWWMLLMTGVYFHSFFEKLFGLIWGYIEVVAVMFFSQYLPVAHEYLAVVPV